ncbi:PiggyBac transposable element-derived protein 4 [Trichinella spiralis]|uniref:PiggyBac transposable element-derived protein 4 n=1 Tax=Trichinella spiralis TaxID=6334 RepID=A0A0V1BNA0_TRISP|nr:PiggyBac transposable element-derived protein 4 [Trichinella spiralis]
MHGSDELLEFESDVDVFLYIYDESDDADSNSEEAAIYSELENEYTSPNGIIWHMHILKKREFTFFSEVYAALGTIIRADSFTPCYVLQQDNLRRSQSDGRNGSRRTFIPSKAAKYGVKIYWICEADNGYALKGFLYTGRSGEEREIGLTSTIVAQLAQPFVQSNRNVFMDRYFTSYSILQHLLDLGLTAVGTVSANRRDVPLCLRNTRGRDVYSTLVVYEHNKKVIMMISYVPRKNKNVLLMTSCHTKLKIDNQRDDRRPNIINDYNLGKGGVDSRDSRIEDFSCKRKTNKCTMLMLYLIVDVCINNAYLLMSQQQSYKKTKKHFMKELSAQNIETRYQNEKIYGQTKDAFIRYGLLPKPGRSETLDMRRENLSKCQEPGCRRST